MATHIDKERDVMFKTACKTAEDRLRNLFRSVKLDMEGAADELFDSIQRDYRGALGGGDIPEGGVLPRAQRDLRKAQMEKIRRAETVFKQAAGILPEDEGVDQQTDRAGDADVEMDERYSLSEASLSEDEPVDSVEDEDAQQSRDVKMEDGDDSDIDAPRNRSKVARRRQVPRHRRIPKRRLVPLMRAPLAAMSANKPLPSAADDVDDSGIAFGSPSTKKATSTSPAKQENSRPRTLTMDLLDD